MTRLFSSLTLTVSQTHSHQHHFTGFTASLANSSSSGGWSLDLALAPLPTSTASNTPARERSTYSTFPSPTRNRHDRRQRIIPRHSADGGCRREVEGGVSVANLRTRTLNDNTYVFIGSYFHSSSLSLVGAPSSWTAWMKAYQRRRRGRKLKSLPYSQSR